MNREGDALTISDKEFHTLTDLTQKNLARVDDSTQYAVTDHSKDIGLLQPAGGLDFGLSSSSLHAVFKSVGEAGPVSEQSIGLGLGLGPLISCCHCLECLDGTKLASYIEAAAHVQHVLDLV